MYLLYAKNGKYKYKIINLYLNLDKIYNIKKMVYINFSLSVIIDEAIFYLCLEGIKKRSYIKDAKIREISKCFC
ncbi:hypothetical protein ACH24_00870 [Francisella persica ATCC VR-331]|uniref:Uncharacterized protein n=1 Tax=Francisella persica ATCC VR-331 TaxID=1086726 RepID=A0AAC8ZMF2_9GAMM|nr:hypothetical protein ACH24_00870 [Francisella persica ATCC VR-331]ANH77656.1 hypothetical protein FSC845_03680 [Francisella persica ATCC VR-331]